MEEQYLALLKDVNENGEDRNDRTGVGTRSLFGRQIRGDISKYFPLMTSKFTAFRPILGEALWFIEGSSDERRLAEITYGTRDESRTTIWTPNANAPYWKPKARYNGHLGDVYGVQWRHWKHTTFISASDSLSHEGGGMTYFGAKVLIEEHDQIKKIIETIKTNPTDRRMVLTAFNVGELDNMALPPCHMFANFNVSSKGKLNCLVYMRSVDTALGLPFNIASYSLITHMIAQVTNLEVGELIMSLGDTHIYKNHLDGVNEMLTRTPFEPPVLKINPEVTDIDDFKMSDFEIVGYKYHPKIKFDMAV